MTPFFKLLESKFLLWGILAFPSVKFLLDFIYPERYYAEMMYQSGVLSVQLFVLTLSITPISKILQKTKRLENIRGWLLQKRRYFGVASFSYALIHTCLYLRETGDLHSLYLDILSVEIASGWIAVLLMSLPAMTSNNYSMRLLGKKWKKVQQLSYLVAISTIVHWFTLDIFLDVGIIWLSIFLFTKCIHLLLHVRRRSLSQST